MAKIGSYLYLSEKDAIRAQQMFDLKDYTASGRFCEQSVEKSLKAYIEIRGSAADRGILSLYKPRRLYEAACILGLDVLDQQLALHLTEFSDYYYDTNYPGASYFELTEQQAAHALVIMRQVNQLVSVKLAGNLNLF